MKKAMNLGLVVVIPVALVMASGATAVTAEKTGVVNIGSRLELFVDDYLIEKTKGLEQRLHKPTPREVSIVHDAPLGFFIGKTER